MRGLTARAVRNALFATDVGPCAPVVVRRPDSALVSVTAVTVERDDQGGHRVVITTNGGVADE